MATIEEEFDVLDAAGNKTGEKAPRSVVHATGLYHRAVHTWVVCPSTGEVLLQQRAACKDSWPGRWDISSAGHIVSGGDPLSAACRELEEELGITLPPERFRFLFTHLEELTSEQRGRPFINNEFNDVFLVVASDAERRTWVSPTHPTNAGISTLKLQESEVSDVAWFDWEVVRRMYEDDDPSIVPCSDLKSYSRLFVEIERLIKGE